MTMQPRFRVLLCGLVPALVAAALSLDRPRFLANVEYNAYDALVRLGGMRPPGGRIVIVDVDEHSLSAVGQWPWRRDVMGHLIDRLRALGASTIALDIIFAEADRGQDTGPATDVMLADTLRSGHVVLGYAFTFDGLPDGSSRCVKHPLGLTIIGRGDEPSDAPFFRATGAVCSLPILTQAAGASGYLNAAADPDGRIRRVPLIVEFNGRVYPGLALAAVAAVTGVRDFALRVTNVNTSSLMFGIRSVPLDGKGNMLLRFRGTKHTFPYISAKDVLDGQAHADAFTGKLVFIGTTALGTREVVATPFDAQFAGIEVQATVADNLLQQDFIHRPEYGVLLETLIAFGIGIGAVLLVGRLGLVWGAVGVAGSLVALWGGAITLMSMHGTFLSPLVSTLGGVGALAAMTTAQLTIERRRADRSGQETVISQRLVVQALLSLTEVRDADTGRHSRRTELYTRIVASELAKQPEFREYLTPQRIELLARLAPLHDIGKVGVPDRLLHNPGAFSAEEWVEMRKHPAHGRDVLVNAEQRVGTRDDVTLAMAKDIVYTHHEKWDGSGYPQGLRGTEIPIAGRLVALVDVYDALLTRRVYREPISHDATVAFIVAARGTHFDPAVVDAFVRVSHVLQDLSEDLDAQPEAKSGLDHRE